MTTALFFIDAGDNALFVEARDGTHALDFWRHWENNKAAPDEKPDVWKLPKTSGIPGLLPWRFKTCSFQGVTLTEAKVLEDQ